MSFPSQENGYHNLDLSPFKIQSRREITSLLRGIAENKQLIRVLMEHSGEAAVSAILHIDEDEDYVVLDSSSDDDIKARLLKSGNISFETVLDRIRIVFFSTQIQACVYEDKPALLIPIPATLIRLQRREFYRVPTPLVAPVYCTIRINDGDHSANYNLPLQNVSGGGVALIDEKQGLDNTVGKLYPDCAIYLPDNVVIITTLEIRNSHDVSLPNGKISRRVGCVFVGLPKAMLAAIQRYITKLERQQNAKSS